MAIPKWKRGIKKEEEPQEEPQPVRQIPRWKRGIKEDTRTTDIPSGTVVSKASDRPPGETALDYLITHAEPVQSERIEKLSHVPYFTPSWQQTPWKTLHQTAFQIAGEQAHRTLTREEKEEYGYHYTDWESIPIEERKHYYGASRYFESLPPEKRKDIITETLTGRHDVLGREHPPGTSWGMEGIADISPIVLSQRAAEHVKGGKSWDEATHLTTWEALTKTTPEFKSKTFADMPFFERVQHAPSQAMVTAALWPVTLTQLGIKYATGKGDLLDPLGRIESGKTLTGFDVSKSVDRISMGPSGAIHTGVSEGLGALTGRESDAWEKMKEYPVESAFATAGELFGFHVGGTVLRGLKTQISNIWVGLRAKHIPIEQMTTKDVLTGKTIFTESPSARASLQQFRAAYDPITGKYVVTHATPGTFKGPVVKGSTSEFSGLFFTPEHMTSVYFSKISPAAYSYKFSVFPKTGSPSIIRMGLDKISRVPSYARQSYGRFGEYVKGKFGTGWITAKHELGGPEIEALVVKGTPIKPSLSESASLLQKIKGYEYYTKVWGTKLPIRDYALNLKTPLFQSAKAWDKIISYGEGSALYSSGVSYLPFVSSSKIGYGLSMLSSIGSSKVSSVLSYQPSYESSYKPSSKTSSIASYQPSYQPSSSLSSVGSKVSSILSSVASKVSSSYGSKASSELSSIKSYKPSYKTAYGFDPYIPSPVVPPSMKTGGKKEDEQGYSVYVKERYIYEGKKRKPEQFQRMNIHPLTKEDAFNLGSHLTDQSAARSFTVKKTKGKPKPLELDVNPWEFTSNKFYRKNNTFVERTDFAIDTPGELEGITAKGILASMKKRQIKTPSMLRERKRGIRKQQGILDIDVDLDFDVSLDKMLKNLF